MKKVLLFVAVATLIMGVSSCKNSGNTNTTDPSEEKFEKGIYTTAQTKVVEIEFQEGESPYFDVQMLTGNADDRIVWVSFYKKDDVNKNGEIRKGSVPCRYYQVVLPRNEKVKSWGYGPIVTTRPDGSEHTIKLTLVNQPS